MTKHSITTDRAPAAIGTYSQAIRHERTLYVSGQIPLDPDTGDLVSEAIRPQVEKVFDNLSAICEAAGVSIDDALKLTVYLTSLDHFGVVNEVMASRLTAPYPARAAIEVSRLPRGAQVEVDAIVALP